MKPLLLLSSLLALPALASAQLTTIGPFTGDESEGFETSVAGQFNTCISPRIFNGTADLCSPMGQATMHVTSGWSFLCGIPPHSGSRLFGSAGGASAIAFDSDVTEFGGYFGTNAWAAGNPNNDTVTVEFLARNGSLIGAVTANVTADCQYNWNGWRSTTGIAQVIVTNSAFGGGFVMLDDLEYSLAGTGGIGTQYCTSNPNSTGQTALCVAVGSNVRSANNVTLQASQLPLNSFGFFLTSRTAAVTPNPGGSQGVLCLGGSIGRYVGPGNIKNSGSTGSYQLVLNLGSMPQPTGSVSAMVGETWRFQSWYRDSNPSVTSNFTNAYAVTFN